MRSECRGYPLVSCHTETLSLSRARACALFTSSSPNVTLTAAARGGALARSETICVSDCYDI